MEKQIFAILGGGILVLAIIGVSLRQFGGKDNIFLPPIQEKNSTSSSLVDTLKTSLGSQEEKKLDGKETVEAFLQAISDHKSSEAVGFMAPKAVNGDNQKQAWGVHFNAFKSLIVKSIEPSMAQDWTKSKETYKVTMDVEMKPESANGPIPYYGYEKGSNIRWISVEKTGDIWKVLGIATGP
jgi:hypothetical protein